MTEVSDALELDREMERVWTAMDVGAAFGPVTYVVDDRVIDAYCGAAEAVHPWYRGASPFGARLSPPELPCTDYSTLTVDTGHQIGFHSRHQAEFARPIVVGDTLTATGTIAEKFKRRGFRYFVLDFRQINQRGELVCAQAITSSVGVLRDPAYVPEPRPPRTDTPLASGATTLPEATVILERVMTQDRMNAFAEQVGVRWGEVGGGGAHTDAAFAAKAGLSGTNAQSLHYVAWASDALAERWGAQWLAGGALDFKFMGQVGAGDTVTIAVRPDADGTDGPAGGQGDEQRLAVRVTNQHGALVSAGTVTAAPMQH